MEKKLMGWKTKGMNRDLSVSAFNNEFSFENMNLRLSTNENNTTMSWVNEKGTSYLSVDIIVTPWDINSEHVNYILGNPIGTAVLNHQLILFTTDPGQLVPQLAPGQSPNEKRDYIYLLKYSGSDKTKLEGKILYQGNLNFNSNYPLETLVSYEAEHIQKVYWTDGYNQPRMINVAASDSKLEKWNSTTDNSVDAFFDFVPAYTMNEDVSIVQNVTAGGLFAPGVIQYAFTYINKYGQQTNLVYVSPLYYLAHSDRGASPEGVGNEKCTSSFEITINNIDQNFDYVRLYSLQRTSLDLEPLVKHLDDIPIKGTTEAELFSKENIYSADNALTLPINEAEEKILTVKVRNGSYDVTVYPKPGTVGMPNNSTFTFVGQRIYDGVTEDVTSCSLQELINSVFNASSCADSIKRSSYYVGIQFTDSICNILQNAILHYSNWVFRVVIENQTYEYNHSQMRGSTLVYNFKNECWYLTNSNIAESEVKDTAEGGSITYVDNGTTGSTLDPTELLYIGGREITALTMTDKDHTLFLGNIEQKNALVSDLQDYFNAIRDGENATNIEFRNDGLKTLTLGDTTGIYSYKNELSHNQREITTFKGGETYRFGFQLQKADGEWTEPVFIDDKRNLLYPKAKVDTNDVSLVYAQGTIDWSNLKSNLPNFNFDVYKRIRPVVVYPTIGDRSVLCQGVLNPTVFNAEDRAENAPFAQASWFFRPYMNTSVIGEASISGNVSVEVLAPVPEKPHYSPDSHVGDNVRDCYILVAKLDKAYADNILKRKYLRYEGQDQLGNFQDYTASFNAAIRVAETTYILIKYDEAWSPENYDRTSGSFLKYYDIISSTVETTEDSFKIYSKLHTTANNTLIFSDTDEPVDFTTYVFQCYTEDNLGYKQYEVTFTKASDENSKYIPSKSDDYGDGLAFSHYEGLPCQIAAGNGDNHKGVEIQGSNKKLNSVFDLNSETVKSNMQFFVDQSIVTFNSPDIEFDTEAQSYGVEGLKLRVIGAIPITGYASAHKITASASLETAHNISNASSHYFGHRELDKNILHYNISARAGQRLVAEDLWNDVIVKAKTDADTTDENDKIESFTTTANYMIFPWHHSGSLTNDPRKDAVAGACLQAKKMSHLLFSSNTEYLDTAVNYENIDVQVHLTENEFIKNYRLPRQKSTSSEVNYYPNVDKVLTAVEDYNIMANISSEGSVGYTFTIRKPVSMRYLSTSHAIVALNASDEKQDTKIPILPCVKYGELGTSGEWNYEASEGNVTAKTFWNDDYMEFTQEKVDVSNLFLGVPYSLLWLGEIYKDVADSTRFGGRSKEAVRNNRWLVGGDTLNIEDSIVIDEDENETLTLKWTTGDTYYQRYDTLKTYSMTPEDDNQIVEILSFMCETHVNIDGRYDKNRGQIASYDMHPTIFNQLNPVYSQKDNFFNSRQLDTEDVKDLKYPNQIYYSKTKNSGSDVDLWTNVTLATTLEMDGDKGQITSLNRLNNAIIVFQDSGISQVLYNENMQISTTQGVPVEIANSGKVTGKRYFSDAVGCSNKWSIVQTPLGIYFMDSNNKNIYLFNGQLQNISGGFGFNVWAKSTIPSSEIKWTPTAFANFTGFYDKQNQDVLFVNKDTALAYSEKLGAFTSFYSYENSPYLCSLDDTGIWLKWSRGVDIITGEEHSNTHLWKHNAGEYCKFFGYNKQYWMTLVGNPEPLRDKIFTNLEFRATVDEDGEYNDRQRYVPYLPFDSLEVWNEYQHGNTELKTKWGHRITRHHDGDNSTLARNYRIWRCDIPRDNTHRMDRMRNPWVYLKLQKSNSEDLTRRTEIHDILMTYFV